MSADIINELRSAATTLRTPTGCMLPAQDRITAELLDRAADALSDRRGTPAAQEAMWGTLSREWAIKGMPADKQRLARAAFDAGREVAPVNAATVDPEHGRIDPSWSLHDRIEFALRDTGFDLDEAAFVAEAASVAKGEMDSPNGYIRITDGFAYGQLVSADFEADTITLRMEPGYQVRAGRHGLFHMPQGMQDQVEPTAAATPPPPAPPAPRWADAPAWARFVAMDADGKWSWYEKRPYPDTELGSDEFTLWDSEDGRIQPISSRLRFDGWENSLQERPAPTVSVKVAGAPLSAEQAAEAMRQIEGDEVQR